MQVKCPDGKLKTYEISVLLKIAEHLVSELVKEDDKSTHKV